MEKVEVIGVKSGEEEAGEQDIDNNNNLEAKDLEAQVKSGLIMSQKQEVVEKEGDSEEIDEPVVPTKLMKA